MIRPVNYKLLNFRDSYDTNYVHPEFKPYHQRETHPENIKTGHLIANQVRKDKSYDFKPLGRTQVCPANFVAEADTSSGRNIVKCVYDRSKEVDQLSRAKTQITTPSSTFEMRSVDSSKPGAYKTFYKGKNACTTQKYVMHFQ